MKNQNTYLLAAALRCLKNPNLPQDPQDAAAFQNYVSERKLVLWDKDKIAWHILDRLGSQYTALEDAAKEFCAKVERGETRSVRSYAAFKKALSL